MLRLTMLGNTVLEGTTPTAAPIDDAFTLHSVGSDHEFRSGTGGVPCPTLPADDGGRRGMLLVAACDCT